MTEMCMLMNCKNIAEETHVNESQTQDRKVHGNEISKTWPKRRMLMNRKNMTERCTLMNRKHIAEEAYANESQKHGRRDAC